MTRIIAGRYRGHLLTVPSSGTRPTTDRVREAVFSAITSRIDLAGTAVLDLFAGSGALGIEAVSRGADTAWFIEKSGPAVNCLRANCRRLTTDGIEIVIRRAVVPGFLHGDCPRPGGFELVLADPPYSEASRLDLQVLESLVMGGWLAPHAVVMWERSSRSPATRWPPELEPVFERAYGETLIELGRW